MGFLRKIGGSGLVVIPWSLLVLYGLTELFVFSHKAGSLALAQDVWPKDSRLKRTEGRDTLVVFVHPRCSCSEATLAELERMLPFTRGRFRHIVIFTKPNGLPGEWVKDRLWRSSTTMQGVETVIDEGGVEALRFGARTSGQVFLYDHAGVLVFQGGITPARGHEGDSKGKDAILRYASTSERTILQTSVFGCSLSGPARSKAEGHVEDAL